MNKELYAKQKQIELLEKVLKEIKDMEQFADDVDNCLLISYHEVIEKLEQELKRLQK